MNKQITVDKNKLSSVCRKYHIGRLSIFGSALRDDFSSQSDIDLLVEFEPGRTPGFFQLYDIECELAALFPGRHVDLRTPQDLSRDFRDRILAEAEVQYVQG